MNPRALPGRQRGAATLVTALLILVALALMVSASNRLVLVQHRMSANSARADAAFAAAESGVQNALAYLTANRAVINSSAAGGWRNAGSVPHWTACAGQTALPCGDGTVNLYDASWLAYGPLPNQPALPGGYTSQTWLLSNTLDVPTPEIPYLGCLNVGLTSVLPPITVGLVNTLNGILSGLLGALLGQPGLGLPTDLCLPLNFSEMPPAPRASQINPGINVVVSASNPADPAGGAAQVQQVLATRNLFAGLPPAMLMVNGTADFTGDIRIWGNPRPPTRTPADFSVLKLNDVLGLNVTSLLNALLGGLVGPLTTQINTSFAPLLNTTLTEVLAFDWNVTFPLSIWSSDTTTLDSTRIRPGALGIGASILSGARTCTPQFGGTPDAVCLPLSQSLLTLNLLGVPLAPLLPLKLPDVQDPENLVSAISGLISGGVPPFPADLFEYIFGYPSAQAATIRVQAIEKTACSGISAPGLYWVTGNCDLSGTVGTAAAPVVIVASGNVTLAAGTDFWGVLYLRGNGAKSFDGPASGTRPTVHGAIVSEGRLSASRQINLAYDFNVIRAAGYLAGGFAPLPGGWHDALLGP